MKENCCGTVFRGLTQICGQLKSSGILLKHEMEGDPIPALLLWSWQRIHCLECAWELCAAFLRCWTLIWQTILSERKQKPDLTFSWVSDLKQDCMCISTGTMSCLAGIDGSTGEGLLRDLCCLWSCMIILLHPFKLARLNWWNSNITCWVIVMWWVMNLS